MKNPIQILLVEDDEIDAEAVVRAFQRRWLPDRISGTADIATLRQIGVIQALYTAD